MDCFLQVPESFMPYFHIVGASGNIWNTKVPIIISYRMKWMTIYPNEGLHPTMYVALNDEHARFVHFSSRLSPLEGQEDVCVKSAIKVNVVQRGITIHDFDGATYG